MMNLFHYPNIDESEADQIYSISFNLTGHSKVSTPGLFMVMDIAALET